MIEKQLASWLEQYSEAHGFIYVFIILSLVED
jgi:hypothetical protein